MKKSLNQTSEAEAAERNALTRKLYRYISEAARRVDEGTARSHTLLELFAPSLEVSRQKLRDNCEKLILADPLLYGQKAQELLWRKGYYEAVATAKRMRGEAPGADLILAHIEAGIGHYHSLISKVQTEIQVTLTGLIDFPQLDTELDIKHFDRRDELKDWARSCIQNCLVYLGDLSRYKIEFEDFWDPSLSARYYLQAAGFKGSSGMPYNQLGTLYTGKNHHLDSVRYYILCMSCADPFDGAEGNLVRILDKNAKYLEENIAKHPDIIDQQESVKNFICKFLSLTEYWFFEKTVPNFNELCTATLYDLKECLQYRPLVMPDLKSSHGEHLKYLNQNEITPEHLSPRLLYKVAMVSLLCMDKLQKQSSAHLFPLKAFNLAVLSQLLQKLLSDLQEIGFEVPKPEDVVEIYRGKMRNLRNMKEQLNPKQQRNGFNDNNDINKNDIEDTSEIDIDKISERKLSPDSLDDDGHKEVPPLMLDAELIVETNNINPNIKGDKLTKAKPKKSSTHIKRRRKRRLNSYDSSEKSESEGSSDFSDADDKAEAQISVSDDTSDVSYSSHSSSDEDEDFQSDKEAEKSPPATDIVTQSNNNSHSDSKESSKENLSTAAEDERCPQNGVENNKIEVREFSSKLLMEFLENENIFLSLRLLLNWLHGEADLIVSCGSSGRALFQTLVDVLNIVHRQFFPKLVKGIYEQENQYHPSLIDFHKAYFTFKYCYKPMALPEDYEVRSIEVLETGLSGINWDYTASANLSHYEANTVRLLRFLDFGIYICKLNVGIVYNKRLKMYLLKRVSTKRPSQNKNKFPKGSKDPHYKHQKSSRQHSKYATEEGEEINPKSGSNNLMKSLGRLWLSEQVRQLESDVKSGARPQLPAYVVIDAAALVMHTALVKQLVATRRLIVLIPTIVLQSIDELKKESGDARSAIRWLEVQLRNGSRFLRAQRPAETAPLPYIKYPKKMHKDMHQFVQIIEFCHFFLSKENENSNAANDWNGSGDKKPNIKEKEDDLEDLIDKPSLKKNENGNHHVIVLLTGSIQLTALEQKDFSFTGIAQTAGVTIENIEEFCLKWKNYFGRGGRKR